MNTPASQIVLDEDIGARTERVLDLIIELTSDSELPPGLPKPQGLDSLDLEIFKNSVWISAIFNIQGWLNLNEELSQSMLNGELSDAAEAFFEAAGHPSSKACITITSDGLTTLTNEGLSFLEDLLIDANSCREYYKDRIEYSDKKAAKKNWLEHWEQLEVTKNQISSDPIKAKAEVWAIQEFKKRARDRKLELAPSYQRGDVWATADAQKLIESILKAIPLPSVILLAKESNTPNSTGATYEVVDGKQRITAILRFIGWHPVAVAKVTEEEAKAAKRGQRDTALLHKFQNDYPAFMRTWKNIVGTPITDAYARDNYFPFRLPEMVDANFSKKYYTQLKHLQIRVADTLETIEDVFEYLSEYRIPVIIYTQATPAQIHNVFHLYNRQGKHLNAEEIRNAVYHDVSLLRLLHALSGDGTQAESLIPYMASDSVRKEYPSFIGNALKNYNFGTARFRRTKVLCWLVATALYPSYRTENGQFVPAVKSTSKIINDFLDSIGKQGPDHPLENTDTLVKLADTVFETVRMHAKLSEKCFPDEFRGEKGWDELQLIGTLLGFFLVVGSSENPSSVLSEKARNIYDFLSKTRRPAKAQNKTQWAFIAKVAVGIVNACEISPQVASAGLESRFGESSVLNTLVPFAELMVPESD